MASDRLYRRKDKRGRPTGPWLAWWYEVKGERRVRRFKSTGQLDYEAARIVRTRWERESADPVAARLAQATLVDAFRAMFRTKLMQVEAGTRSAATIGALEEKAIHWVDVLGDGFRLRDLAPDVIDGYLDQRRAQGNQRTKRPLTLNTLSKELGALRHALKHAKRAGLFAGDISALFPVGLGDGYIARKRVVRPDELAALLRELEPDHAARAAFIVATSARRGETERARREDVGERVVYLRGTKTERSNRHVPISTPVKPLLALALEKAQGRGGLLFAGHGYTFGMALRRTAARLGFAPLTPNDLRRTFATWLREAGVPLELIAPAMGHVDTRMVERVYGRMRPDALHERLEAALSSHEPFVRGLPAPK